MLGFALVGCGSTSSSGSGLGSGGAPGSEDPLPPSEDASASSDGDGPSDESDSAGDDGANSDDDDDDDDDEGGPKFDIGEPQTGDDAEDCDCVETDWSYVWIANSSEGTVSKINTRTLVEEGRYKTRETPGSPSRTSVSVDARAVAVANRHVGLIKIWAQKEFCTGMDPDTSTGPNDVKEWNEDDCVAWYLDFPGATVQRPVAWTPGVLNEETCEYEEQKIWTTTGTGGGSPGMCGPNGVTVHLIDGDTGTIDDEVFIPNSEFPCGFGGGDGLGPYGGAVDHDGNFWFHGFGNDKLVRVELATMTYEIVSGGAYGITVDSNGRVWTNWVRRYDPVTKDWDDGSQLAGSSGGIAEDLEGRMWFAEQGGVRWMDVESMVLGDRVDLPYSGQAKGVSADIDGFVWVTFQDDTKAYRIDPQSYEVAEVSGLDDPYTYSDMTGGQLANVNCNDPVE